MNRFYLLFLALIFQFSQTSFAKEIPSFSPNLQLGFVENIGQIKNQNGAINKDVLYLFRAGNMQVQLRKNGFSYELFQESSETALPHVALENNTLPEAVKIKIHRVDINFKNANSKIDIIETERANGDIKYASKEGRNSSLLVHHFKQILYKNVYPNIDIEFLIAERKGQQQFKYNVILHPGANANLVQFAVFGSNQTQVNEKGGLDFTTSIGDFEEKIPMSYELKKDGSIGGLIAAKFVQLNENTFGFGLNQNVSNKTRVIDPLLWCTYFGGNGTDLPIMVKEDTLGDIYITGSTNSTLNIATAGAYQTTHDLTGDYELYLAKFTKDGAIVWATFLGGVNNENVYGMAITKENNVVIVGNTASSNGFSTAGAYQTIHGGGTDGFISVFGPSGNMVWSTYFGGPTNENFQSVDVDKDGDIVVVGSSNSAQIFNFPGIHQTTNGGITDILLLKMSSLGALKWATYYGGSGSESAFSICSDNAKNIYISGTTGSIAGITGSNPYQASINGTLDGVIAKFSPDGKLLFGTYFGGANVDYPRAISINKDGNLAIAGYTYSSIGFPLLNAYQTTFYNGSSQGFVCMMDTTGDLLWSTYFGGEVQNILLGSCLDKHDNIYFGGYTSSKTKIATAGAFKENSQGVYDAFFGSFNKLGGLNWASYYGGENVDYGWRPYVDKKLNLYLLGYSNSDTSVSYGSVYQNTRNGAVDCFLAKFSLDTSTNTLGNNTIGSNQTLCGTSVAADLIGSTPIGGTGSYTYTWMQSSTGISGSFVNASGVIISRNYSPGSISSQTYYQRVVFDGDYYDTSNVVVIDLGTSFNAGFTVNKSIQCLRSNQFIFTDTTSASGLTYDWDFGNGATSTNQSETISYAYQAANVYRVRLITSFGGSCADTNYKMVYTVSDPIAKNITGIDQVRRLDTASYSIPHTAGSRYSWIFDKGQLRGNGSANQIQILWTNVGTTQLKVVETSSGNCLGDTAFLDITISPALELVELTNENAYQMYPNPNNGSFVISGLNQKEFIVNVYDARGALVKTQVIQGETRIELENARAGLYVIQLINEDGNVYQKKLQINAE